MEIRQFDFLWAFKNRRICKQEHVEREIESKKTFDVDEMSKEMKWKMKWEFKMLVALTLRASLQLLPNAFSEKILKFQFLKTY